ncbi:MAG: CPBP family intramembrane metalloprotease [Clostridia bacterium]|nr:CPBP family intramembrane metalloprotease [Clostridia bacterium]
MEEKKISEIAGIIIGTAIFALVILFMIFAAFPIQAKLGMTGVVITEICFLAIAAVSALVFKQNPKEVFKLKLPTLWEIFGTLALCAATYIAGITSVMGIAAFFPTAAAQTSGGMQSVISSVPFFVGLLVIGILPAICEEALHRGVILHFYGKSIKNEWIVIIVMGILFGIFHLDPIRFLPTAIFGGAVTYVAFKTKSILPCIIFHMLNNFPGVFFSNMMDVSREMTEIPLPNMQNVFFVAFGCMLAASVVVPWLVLASSAMLNVNKKEETALTVKIAACAASSVLLFAGGVAVLILGTMKIVGEYGLM